MMHTEKSFFENIIKTVMDVHEKTKDNVKSIMDAAYIYVIEKNYIPGQALVKKLINQKQISFLLWIKEESRVNGRRDLTYLIDIALI